MSNCYSFLTAEDSIPCSDADYAELKPLLDANESGLCHEFHKDDELEKENFGQLYLFADENFIDCDFEADEKLLKKLGEIIGNSDRLWLEFGVACFDDHQKPGSSGGYRFRLHKDGHVEHQVVRWPQSEE